MPDPNSVPLPDPQLVYDLVRTALTEDGAFRDLTTQTTVDPDQQGRATFLAKESGVVCGLLIAASTFAAISDEVEMRTGVEDGDWVERGRGFAQVVGPLPAILSGERVALNFLQRLSGIATATRLMADKVIDLPVRILDTRKTTPGLRPLERYAVRIGGGYNHRFNLADGILIKDNHIAAARVRGGALADVVRAARAGAPHTMRIEVEVTTLDEVSEALDAGADILLLDNMTPPELRRAVMLAKGRALTEASGGVTLENVRAIAETGVDFISSGALTHSVKALDISLEVEF